MKNIFRIFIKDIRNIAKNWVAVIVVLGLMVIPSFYSLFNIKASWDPYGNTGGIKIAVVNEDKGTVFKEQGLNLGEELVEKLQDNTKMDWVFVDKDMASNGLLMEEYYAMIEIPEDFSENVTTLVSKDVKKPKLIYTVNEKINAIAPKLTDAGVKSIKTQLDENIIKTVSGVLFRVFNEVGVEVEENKPQLTQVKDDVYELEESIPQLKTILDSAIEGTTSIDELLVKVNEIIPNISQTIEITDEFLGDSYDVLDKGDSELSDISPIIKEDLLLSENIIDTSITDLANIDENILPRDAQKILITSSDSLKALKITNESLISKLKGINKFIDEVVDIKIKNIELPDLSAGNNEESENNSFINITQDELDAQIKHLRSIQKDLKEINKVIENAMDKLDVINGKLDIATDRMDEEITKLENGEKVDIQVITDIRSLLDDSHDIVYEVIDAYDSDIKPAIEKIFNLGREVLSGSLDVIKIGRGMLPDVEKLISEFNDVSVFSREKLIELKDKFPEIEDKVHELADKLREFDEEDKLDEVLDMITNNWETQSSFFASPVEIVDNRLFKWENYGSASTPFYTTLCLWVGGYMLSMLLSTEVHHLKGPDGEIEVKPYEEYFGKMLLFLFIGIFQALIASIGALVILGVQAVHPIMFIAFTVFASIVFMTVIYTGVSVFGNGGIIIGIVLLVLQVAGTSGNFPIEVNPAFFQKLFPYYPFTYAISGMRQVLAGIVYSIFWRDVKILSIFMAGSIVFGLLFKKFFNDRNMRFVKKLKESKLMVG